MFDFAMVFLVERIDADSFASQEKMRHMNAVCFLRPTNKNFLKLSQELKNPKYNEYHLFFTNVVPHVRLDPLASCDEYELVKQVQEFFADVYAVNHDLFSLNLPSTVRLTEDHHCWSPYEESVFERIIEGLLATCLALRMLPAIRYTGACELTRQLAHRLESRIHEEQSLFEGIVKSQQKGESTPVLLLFDRRNDPVTPLLQQWTYQAMVHELLGMTNNMVDLKKVSKDINRELETIVMSPLQDQFFNDNLFSNFGDLGQNIRKYVEKYQNDTKNTARIESIEEMQRFVDEYPEFRRLSGNVSKHVNVVSELSALIEAHGLLEEKVGFSATTKRILKVGLPEPIAQEGNWMTIHVQIGLGATGKRVWSSKDCDRQLDVGSAVTFQVGQRELFYGLDCGCLGMTPREQRRLYVPAAEAFAAAACPAMGILEILLDPACLVQLLVTLDQTKADPFAGQASQLEQDIACTENRQEHFRTLVDLLKNSKITTVEGLRLVLLFALRYEQEYNSIAQLKDQLRIKKVGDDQIGLIDKLLRYAGSQVRSSDLFQNKSFLQIAKSTLTNSFKGVENVYTQHKTHLSTVVESLMKGRLKETSYPYMQSKVSGTAAKDPPRRAVVFVVGGCTYEEARDIAELNKTADGAFRPWQEVTPDPPDLPSNEVACIAAIETRCRDDYLPHVALNFTWFSDTGELSNPVHLGALSSETWQKEGEPEPIVETKDDLSPWALHGIASKHCVLGDEAAQDAADPPPLSAENDAEEVEEKRFIEKRRYEITSPNLRATCDFIRSLAVQALRIEDPKKDKKKDQAEETEVDDSFVKVEILVPLAPLIVQRCQGPSISQDVLVQMPCPGLFDLKVTVRCSGPLLHLNPLLITLGGVHKLPKELHLSQQEKVYAVLDAFGERRRTVPMSINAEQNVPFQAHLVYFIGTWPQHETREYLQLARLKVEVHDRDKAATIPPVEESPPVPPTPDTKDAKKKPQDISRALTCHDSPRMWHGVSSFTIADLLNPRLNHPLNLRSDVEPKRKAGHMGGGRNLQVSQLLNNGEESRKLLASVEKAEFQNMPRYFEGSWVRLSAALAQPMADLQAGAVQASQQSAEEESPKKVDSVEEAMEPSTPRYERFARLVVVVDYRKTTVVKQLLQTVQQHNAEAMELDIGQARAIATVKLDDEQKKLDLDILTGFIVMDRRARIIVVECLRDGKALSRLLEVLPEENTNKLKVMFNPELGFSKRLYVDFNLVLKQVKLRQSLDGLTQRPDLCLPSKCDVAERIHVLKLMNSFPSAVCIEDIETQYGDFVNERELHGGCMDAKDDAKSAHSRNSRMTGRTGASARPRSERSGRSGKSGSGQGSFENEALEAEDVEGSEHDDEGSLVEEVKVRNAKIVMKPKLDSVNPMYERVLECRQFENPDMMRPNKKAVKDLSRNMKAVASPRKVGPRKEVDRSFLEPGMEVHIYSGQAKNSAELQKRILREKMQDEGQLWTYSAERNSGCFPLLEKEVPLDRMLRQEVPQDCDHWCSAPQEDNRKPFKYPSPREAADYRRMPNQVSDSRKEDLQAPWVENQLHPELELKESCK
eukprot:s77_g15.t2